MHKRLLAVAVAGALAAPAVAIAQSAVTVSGAVNIWWESAGATGATNAATTSAVPNSGTPGGDIKARDRIQDGAGSNVRFTAVEDIGSGLQGFAQVESAVVNNADTRNNAINAGAAVGGWGTRNTGVGLRGAGWGEVLIGIWDIHYNEHWSLDSQIIKGTSSSNTLGVLGTFGTPGMATVNTAGIGGRYSNVIRYQSPNWSGFNFKLAYARPTDGAIPNLNAPTVAAGDINGATNRVYNFAPQYANGPVFVGYSYIRDKDIIVGANTLWNGGALNVMAPGLEDVTGQRFTFSWTFPFGLKAGVVFDRSQLKVHNVATGAAGSELKRNAWALPVVWSTGPHAVFFTYARAAALKGSIGNAAGVSTDITQAVVTPTGTGATAQTVGNSTSAKFMSIGYQFDLSKRTNVHVSWTQITNDAFAGYDTFSNTTGMTNTPTATQAASFGADPRVISLGLRHTF